MIKIGADPEFFVQFQRHIMSAHVFDFGTKEKPMKTDNGTVQVDGTALEINVTPATTREEFIKNFFAVKTDLEVMLYDLEPRAKIVARPSVFFGRRKLAQLPPAVSMLGCSPDWDAYEIKPNPAPNASLPFRTGSGHIHLSWVEAVNPKNKDHIKTCATIARELDYTLGLPSLIWDKDNRRRELYGRAGAFRPKSYGMEYRVLSNAWCTTAMHVGWIFDAAKRTVEQTLSNGYHSLFHNRYGFTARNHINRNDPSWVSSLPYLKEQVLQ